MKLKYAPYSPSRLETATCGYQFKHTYIEPRPEARKENLPQARGSAVHEVFEKITAILKEDPARIIQDHQVRTWAAEAVNRHPAAYQEIQDVIRMAHLYIRKPAESITANSEIELRLAVKFTRDENGEIVYYDDIIEDKIVKRPAFEECSYDDPEAVARGRADILTISDDTTTAFIVDHKTQPNKEDADTFQMGFYAWVISRIYPFLEEIQTVLHFAQYGSYSDSFVWSKADLYRIEDQFLARMEIIESKTTWEATSYKNCQYCPFMMECPVMKEFIEIDEESGSFRLKMNNLHIINDTNKAVKMAGLLNMIDELSTQLKKGLRTYVQNTGPVAIPGKIFEFRGEPELNWEKVNGPLREGMMGIFQKHGVEPTMFMGFSQTFSKSVWMLDKPELVKELSDFIPRKTKVTFSGYKA